MALKMDEQYLKIFLDPIRESKSYKPKFGQGGNGLLIRDFKALYGSDPFYKWLGLDTNIMYTAHRVAGGMTSVYRQIGIGCERLFRAILMDTTGYEDASYATWSYTTKTRSGKDKKLSLDGRLELEKIENIQVAENVRVWIEEYCSNLGDVKVPQKGIVFEVRQGYKSKDSKRQNADIDNATVAWANDYLPVFAIFSSQIDTDIILRYRNNRCGVLTGIADDDTQISLYAFFNQVLNYDLANFFDRNSEIIKLEIQDILETLLSTKK